MENQIDRLAKSLTSRLLQNIRVQPPCCNLFNIPDKSNNLLLTDRELSPSVVSVARKMKSNLSVWMHAVEGKQGVDRCLKRGY